MKTVLAMSRNLIDLRAVVGRALSLLIVLLPACSPMRQYGPWNEPIGEVTLIAPVCHVAEGLAGQSDFASETAQAGLIEAILTQAPKVKNVLNIPWETERPELLQDIVSLRKVMTRDVKNIPYPESIASYLETRGFRYGMLVFQNGLLLSRRETWDFNTKNESQTTGRMSSVNLMIIDTKNRCVVYFDQDTRPDYDPTDWKKLSKQVRRILRQCPWNGDPRKRATGFRIMPLI